MSKLWLIIVYVKFSLASRSLYFNAFAGWFPANIVRSDIPLKARFFGLHISRRICQCIFNYFYVICSKTTEFGEITQSTRQSRRSRSFNQSHRFWYQSKPMWGGGAKGYTIHTICVYRDEILHRVRGPRHNHPCKFRWRSMQGFLREHFSIDLRCRP